MHKSHTRIIIIALLVVLGLLYINSRNSRTLETYAKPTNISFYGGNKKDDNGIGFTGVDLFAYGRIPVMFGKRRVYPVSVPPDMFEKLGYMVLKIESPGMRTFYGHVMDICAQGKCSVNRARGGVNMLIDVHKTAWATARKNDGVLKGSYTVVGRLRPKQLPTGIWTKPVQKGSESLRCRVNGKMDWVVLNERGRCT